MLYDCGNTCSDEDCSRGAASGLKTIRNFGICRLVVSVVNPNVVRSVGIYKIDPPQPTCLVRVHFDNDLVAKCQATIIRHPFHRLKQGIERGARGLVSGIVSRRKCLEYQPFVAEIVGSDVSVRGAAFQQQQVVINILQWKCSVGVSIRVLEKVCCSITFVPILLLYGRRYRDLHIRKL